MKIATICLFLFGLTAAHPSLSVNKDLATLDATSPITDAIAAKVENYLAEKIRSIDPQAVADQAIADLGPAITRALSDYSNKIKTAQFNVVVAAQRAALQKRDPQATAGASVGGPMAAASAELKKVSEDVGVSIGTMIGK
jgi:hypothetical protein